MKKDSIFVCLSIRKEKGGVRLVSMGETKKILQGPRHHTSLKKPLWLVLTVSVTSMLLICTHMYPRQGKSSSCHGLGSTRGCEDALSKWLPVHVRKFTDEEIAARAVARDILRTPPFITENSKIAFLFLTPGTLPFEKLWDQFFKVTNTSMQCPSFSYISLICCGFWVL